MYNNKLYNTRNTARYNTAGQFVAASGESPQQFQGTPRRQQQQQPPLPPPPPPPQQQQQQQQQFQQQFQQPTSNLQEVPMQEEDTDMKPVLPILDENMSSKEDRPAWMKPKLTGVKKIPNRERRRRQNETLRRLLTPKNALMVLNEMMPREHLANQFTVEAAQNQYYSRNNYSFCADLTLEGTNYKGYGENKLSARNNAAEQAIRDLIIKKMNKVVSAAGDGAQADICSDEEALPMIQLASFALHKLFTEWEVEGHKVPQLRPSNSVSEAGPAGGPAGGGAPPALEAPAEGAKPGKQARAAKPRLLPANAPAMHPCMLLTYMKPGVEYRELAAEGDKPQNMLFTMGVDVDGATYIGKASNKKEARKQAARAACAALYGVAFEGAPAPGVKPVLG